MPVLFSAALLICLVVYASAVSSVAWFQMLPFISAIRSMVAGRALLIHSAAIVVSLIAAGTAFAAIFLMRDNELMVGNKRVLLWLGLAAVVMTGVLLFLGKDLLWPFLEGIFQRYF